MEKKKKKKKDPNKISNSQSTRFVSKRCPNKLLKYLSL